MDTPMQRTTDEFANRKLLVAGRNDSSILDHQNDSSLRSASAMQHAFGNDEALPGLQLEIIGSARADFSFSD